VTEKLHKFLKNGKAPFADIEYSLPVKNSDGTWTPGKWMPEVKGELAICDNGYHLARPADLLQWLDDELYEAEYRGDRIDGDNKVVVRQARLLRRIEAWNPRTARLFACWCARNTPLLDGRTTWDLLTDERSRRAIEVAERYANGEASGEELAAAGDAARDAARDAAWAAARAAARAAAWDVAWAAAWAAARDAAWAAARDAASASASAAARDAARDAAWDVAWAAAWAAARAAARDVARDAAWGAARDVQVKHLVEILEEAL
jgi:hypothetical protein